METVPSSDTLNSDTLIMGATAAPPKTVPEYQILREIGRGGMSTVYEARDTRTGQTVALKLLALPPSHTPDQQRDLIARFRREARAVAQLSHPNIVVIHEVGERDGAHFLAMEYLTGQTLRERLAAGPMTPAQAQPILAQIAGALDAVHAAGIVHRDVKPSNVVLLPDGTAKLLDFGIARQSDDTTITSTGMIVGSPSYMAPEQVRGEAGTEASDVWALGVLGYEMLAGRPPFQAGTIPAVLYQVTHETPPPIPVLPPALQKVLRRALDKNPARRFRSAGALAEAMRAALPKPPPAPRAVRPPASLPRLWRWAALLALTLALMLLGVGVGSLVHRHAPVPAPPVPVPAAPSLPVAAMPVVHPSPTPITPTSRPAVVKKQAALHKPVRPKTTKPKTTKPKTHVLKPKAVHVPRSHRHPAQTYRRAAGRPRRIIRQYFRRPYRFAPRRSGDSNGAAQLQRFIWSEGR